MNHRRGNFGFLGLGTIVPIAGALLLSIASCHSSTSGPESLPAATPRPPTPAGFISCVGHAHAYADANTIPNDTVWYAFWQESPDSSHATLIVGIDPMRIDTLHIYRDSSFTGWSAAVNSVNQEYVWISLYVTPDSVIANAFGVDAGVYYYLKKLN